LNHADGKYSVTFSIVFLVLTAVLVPAANAATAFSSDDSFYIPGCNSQIRFAADGSYDRAALRGNAWVFDNLTYDAAHNVWGFSVSAKDCNVTITGISAINMPDQIGWITYNVTGVGSQTLGVSSLDGNEYGFFSRYAVFIDGVNRTQGDGWTYTPFTVTGATANVSICYTGIGNPVTLESMSASESPIPTPTASLMPSSDTQPQVQEIYTVAVVIVVVAAIAVSFVGRRLLRSKAHRVEAASDVGVKL
jgi:hypothetical protein